MKMYGEIEKLSENNFNKILSTSKKIIELDINVEVEITGDGTIYHLFIDDEDIYIYDDILYDIMSYKQYYWVLDLYLQIYLNSQYEYKPMVFKVDKILGSLNISNFIHKCGVSSKMINNELNFKINTYDEFVEMRNKKCMCIRNPKLYKYSTNNIQIIEIPIYNVYRFLDKNNNVLYVGKTSNMHERMKQHFKDKSTLQTYIYDKIVKIEYIICENEQDMNEKEKYFISKYKNTIHNKILYNYKHNSDYDSISWNNEYPIPNKRK